MFPIIRDRVKPNTEPAKVPKTPTTVQKKKLGVQSERTGRRRTEGTPLNEGDTSHSQINVVDEFLRFAKMLVKQQPSPDSQESFQNNMIQFGKLISVFKGRFKGSDSEDVTRDDMIYYLSSIIALLLPEQSVPSSPSSPSSASSQSDSSPPPQRGSRDFAIEILETYNYFQDDFEEDDIDVVYEYIMRPTAHLTTLKQKINTKRTHNNQLQGGSSPQNTKRQHRKKQKIKSRRKNKYNTTKTRKNRNS